jgi:hypothetical protein
MIRSRPGFSAVVTKDTPHVKSPAPARVTSDMTPAFAKHTTAAQGHVKSPLKQEAPSLPIQQMQAQAEAAMQKMRSGPELLINPAPSPPPIITSPHKD